MALRVGLLGLNYGARVHLPAYKASGKYELVAVCARSPGRAEAVAREHKVPLWFSDPRPLIARPDLDLVSIATPPGTHGRFAAAALAAGKHVVAEIGLVPTAADARVLADMARDNHRIAAAAYVLRFLPMLRTVSEMLAQNAIGKPRLMRFNFFESFLARPEPDWRLNWMWDAGSGGGVLATYVAHALDLARRWFGPVCEVDATLATLAELDSLAGGRHPAEDTGRVTLRFDSGVLAAFDFSAAVARARTSIELHGSEASLLVDGFGDELSLLPMGEDKARPVYPAPALLEETRGQSGVPGAFQQFLSLVAQGAAAGSAPPDLPTFDDGLEVARLVDAVRLAAREGRRVRLDEID